MTVPDQELVDRRSCHKRFLEENPHWLFRGGNGLHEFPRNLRYSNAKRYSPSVRWLDIYALLSSVRGVTESPPDEEYAVSVLFG